MNNYSIESHFTIYHSASFSSQWSILEKVNICQSKKENSKYNIGIDSNEEIKLIESAKEVCCSISYTSEVFLW